MIDWARALAARLLEHNRTMYPGYFALVMATGIVSTGLWFEGRPLLSQILFGVNVCGFPVVVLATLIRAVRFGQSLWADLSNPRTTFLAFTFVAACNVLGVQCALRSLYSAAWLLWYAGLIAWVALCYISLSALIFSADRSLADTLNAGWLVAIVGTQSVAILGLTLAPLAKTMERVLLITAFGLWGIGIAWYGVFITLIMLRLFFYRIDPPEMLPPYWIVLGATAISSLAGTLLAASSSEAPFLSAVKPLTEGASLLLWAWSTWWLPMLVVLGVWRHGVRKDPLRYHPSFWSLVFPLGMYAVCTYRLSDMAKLPELKAIPAVEIWIALAAWFIVAIGLARAGCRVLFPPRSSRPEAGRPAAGAAPARDSA